MYTSDKIKQKIQRIARHPYRKLIFLSYFRLKKCHSQLSQIDVVVSTYPQIKKKKLSSYVTLLVCVFSSFMYCVATGNRDSFFFLGISGPSNDVKTTIHDCCDSLYLVSLTVQILL